MQAQPSPLVLFLGALGALGLAACSPASERSASSGGAARAEPPANTAAVPRSADPRVVQLREAIEFGRLDVARTLLEQVAALAGPEEPLLRARAALLAGDSIAALAAVEEARAASPDDGRVYACAAEIYAVLGRHDAAAREIADGLAAAGRIPDLERASGVLLIVQSGGSERGLAHLEQALAADPKLPFTRRPLSQAHLLEGRRLLGDGDAEGAKMHALKARELDPAELDAVELEAEARAGLCEFDRALELYVELEDAGRPLGGVRAELHRRAATYELLRQEREKAVAHYRRARELGLDDEALGFGAVVLREETEAAIERGIELYGADDFAAARAAFELALAIAPGSLEAKNHLGVVLFRQEDYRGAAACWREVLSAGRKEDVRFPEPLELNLARALKLAGSGAEAGDVLEDFLRRDPDGPWSAEAREALSRL